MRGIALLKLLSKYIDRNLLALSYRMYIRHHLDYGDVIYHNQRIVSLNVCNIRWHLLFLGTGKGLVGKDYTKNFCFIDNKITNTTIVSPTNYHGSLNGASPNRKFASASIKKLQDQLSNDVNVQINYTIQKTMVHALTKGGRKH